MAPVLLDLIDFGLPETEAGRGTVGNFVYPVDHPRNRIAGPEYLDEWGPTVHVRETALWSGIEIRIPEENRGDPLLLELLVKVYRLGNAGGEPGPTYFYLNQKDRSWPLGGGVIPMDDQWHALRFEVTPGPRADEPLYFVVDGQGCFDNDENHYGYTFGSLAVYSLAGDRPDERAPLPPTKDETDVALVLCPVWDNLMPPIGLGTISSFLRANKVKTKIFDLNIETYRAAPDGRKHIWHGTTAPMWNEQPFIHMVLEYLEAGMQEMASRIAAARPRVVAFSVSTVNAPTTMRLAAIVREKLPDAVIVYGGPGIPFFQPHELGDAWDHLILGAGEYPILHIVKGRRGRLHGLISRAVHGVPESFTERARILDINRMPPLDFAGFDLSLYTNPWRIPVLTSRGCINQCAYCFDHVYYGPFSALSGENAYRQLVHLHEMHGRRLFEFSDLLCNGDLESLGDMCERLVAGGHDFMWGSFAVLRTDTPPELYALMKRAGCRYLHYGFETASPEMLRLMGRNYTPEEARQALIATKEAGIGTRINLMVGFPGETDATVDETIEFIRANAAYIDVVDTVNPVYLMALSELYDRKDDYGICMPDELPDNWQTGDLDHERRERWVLRVIDGVRAAGVRNNLGISRSFQCRFYD